MLLTSAFANSIVGSYVFLVCESIANVAMLAQSIHECDIGE